MFKNAKHTGKTPFLLSFTRPQGPLLQPVTHKNHKAEFYRSLYNSVHLTGLSRLNVIKVVTTLFLHWIFDKAKAAHTDLVFLYVVTS